MRSIALFSMLLLATTYAAPRPAVAAPDHREMQAREAFAASRFQDALDLYVKLYAEQLHPNFLRNIGRCYQNLGDADKAISSFREYLRKAKNVSPEERTEVDGYISEMEAAKKSKEAKEAAAASTPPPTSTSANTLTAVDPSTASQPTATQTQIVNVAPAPPPANEESAPVYKKWWFWAIIGGVAAAGLGGAAAAGVFTTKTDAICSNSVDGRICP